MIPPPTVPAAAAARQRCSSSTPIGSPSRSSSTLTNEGLALGAVSLAAFSSAFFALRIALSLRSSDISTGSPSTSSSASSDCGGGAGAELVLDIAAPLDDRWAQYSSKERSRESSVTLEADSVWLPPTTKPRFLHCRSRAGRSIAPYASILERTAGSSGLPLNAGGVAEAPGTGGLADVGAASAPPNMTASRPCRKNAGKTSQVPHTLNKRCTAASAVRRSASTADPLWPLPFESSFRASCSLCIMPGRASWKVWR
mmetsp:Transcript_40747/g.113240  ORF Transcript_40747/g.113240 Transcript_40747/m.113240 type:complete len:256 (-) Transcript_40747:461-1228(-)